MSCKLTPDLKRSPAYKLTHTPPAKEPTLNCYSSVRLGRASFDDRSTNCIKHLHKTKSHKNGKESSSEYVVASCFKSL